VVLLVVWVLLMPRACGGGSRALLLFNSSNSRLLRLRWLQCSSSSSWLGAVEQQWGCRG
jgi:hypothetical protein